MHQKRKFFVASGQNCERYNDFCSTYIDENDDEVINETVDSEEDNALAIKKAKHDPLAEF